MPIQEQAIPHALAGRDIIAIAQTGTGKTLAFGLPSLTRISRITNRRAQMLVLCPTRELAVQIHEVLQPLAKKLNLQTACLYGGAAIRPQVAQLRRKPSIIIATPGRLQDHIDHNNVSFKNLQILVFDEADRMLDMGFLPDIKRIVSSLPEERQTLLFSATFPRETEDKVCAFVKNPVKIEVAPQATPAESVTQGVYPVKPEHKADLLTKLLSEPDVTSTLVFTRTKIRADRVTKMLRDNGFKAEAIHGDCSQSKRQTAIKRFRSGKSTILVATDIAARGIDVKGVTHVINYDMPVMTEDYVHRIGRTARAKASGIALTFTSPGEERALRSIEKLIGKQIILHQWEGMAELAPVKASSGSSYNPTSNSNRPKKKAAKPRTGNSEQTSARPRAEKSAGNSEFKNSPAQKKHTYKTDKSKNHSAKNISGEDNNRHKTGFRNADARKSDARKSDAYKSDSRKPDAYKSDTRKSDSRKSDSRKPDSYKSDARKYDARKSDSHKSESRKADSHNAENRKARNGKNDFRKSEPRKGADGHDGSARADSNRQQKPGKNFTAKKNFHKGKNDTRNSESSASQSSPWYKGRRRNSSRSQVTQ